MENTEFKFNVALAKSRGLTDEDMHGLNSVYKNLHQILARPSMLCDTPKQAVDIVRGLEYTMQLIWKFPLDKSYHSYWFELQGCTCPKMDNRDRMGTFFNIITDACPYHGTDRAETWEDRRFK
ncbi:MAG: hypothetical protein GOVbin1096_28 [Prokaryotic dsDNA virus sp.]|jgi:hypothetical protein|nr:MAG: hypothetical protein GOVbin1096_28 [Prokaryotic dsDNA virus sp.]|tara:strand:+ start:51564 stop:51932 length:369 start_codon:yes stop_codon:yes gene_type:complete